MEAITGSQIRELLAEGAIVTARFIEPDDPKDEQGFAMEVMYKRKGRKRAQRALLHAERGNVRYFRGCRALINYPRRLGIKDVCFHYAHDHEIKI